MNAKKSLLDELQTNLKYAKNHNFYIQPIKNIKFQVRPNQKFYYLSSQFFQALKWQSFEASSSQMKFSLEVSSQLILLKPFLLINYFILLHFLIYPWTLLKRTSNQNFRLVDRPARGMAVRSTVWTLLLQLLFLPLLFFFSF